MRRDLHGQAMERHLTRKLAALDPVAAAARARAAPVATRDSEGDCAADAELDVLRAARAAQARRHSAAAADATARGYGRLTDISPAAARVRPPLPLCCCCLCVLHDEPRHHLMRVNLMS